VSFLFYFLFTYVLTVFAFSAVTLLVGRQAVLICLYWWPDWSFARLRVPVCGTRCLDGGFRPPSAFNLLFTIYLFYNSKSYTRYIL